MKKEILLGIAIAALYAAAKEYGINSLDDLKAKASPYLKLLELADLGNSSGNSNSNDAVKRKPAQNQSRGTQAGNGKSHRTG